MSMRDRIRAFLQGQADALPDLAEKYQTFGSLQSKKLWHELTQELLTFVNDPANNRGENFIALYDEFIKTFETRVNQLDFVQIITKVASQYHPNNSPDELEAAVSFVKCISGCKTQAPDETVVATPAAGAEDGAAAAAGKDGDDQMKNGAMDIVGAEKEKKEEDEDSINAQKRRKLGDDAFVVMQVYVARLRHQQGHSADCKFLLAESKKILDSLSCADPVVHACYYRLASDFHKAKGPAADYYRNSLQFLVYVPDESLDDAEMLTFATDLSLAALIGEGIYNFGEVLNLSVYDRLKSSEEFGWLSDLLKAFNMGDIMSFNDIISQRSAEISRQPALASPESMAFLKEKIALLALMQLVFSLDSHSRVVPFAAIAQATHLETTAVEWLAMRAMSLGLIKGSIDEVAQTVTVTWVMPRVLDAEQLKGVTARLRSWGDKVNQSALFVEGNTAELFDASIAIAD